MDQASTPDPAIHSFLQEIWQRHLPSTRARLDLLEDAIRTMLNGNLAEAMRAEAQSAAHKLSGNLGMFGYIEAGEAASEIEHIFKQPTPEKLPHLVSFMQQLRSLLAPHL
ncbi:Hpt domain-containing protein [Edaphobacter albus]|uniref:Hpt domain-containing protein n=1 Tax=Edaphobacter sp. 4G125 TaxID=2763071 RepID=UPI00164657FE|nr:Hpt domain-containing protein [Edaphobacter sp. 4G125]QNI38296.1 Hpt domain-containing protein [Edaphobacter sp. 4G125]